MKKVMKIIVGILLVIGIGIGGIGYMQHKEHEKRVAIATSEEARAVYEKHMKANDPKALTADGIIKTYEIDTETLEYNPMGGMMVRVYVNGDEDFGFHFNLLQNEDGKFKSGSYVIKSKLADLLGK
ncbi:DUF1310 family protein [Streptococcus suis]|uniref:DUF1310 domain-containing protein n=3 Tax=Streptococcus suis TaxID=1307 RepID=A0AAW5LZ21_STRSU|nr:DUF1310 family protein [Streptococcus suis]MCL4882090.1 DUF1310 domain-containing protein [Streptococcus suis]MCR1233533.1 DUF1310 domain-containing protein [Streptococcus suis]